MQNRDYDSSVINNSRARSDIDQGLRQYMLRVYNYMAAGLTLTGIVAFFTASSPELLMAIFGTPLRWLVMLAPLGFVLFLSFRINHIKASTAQSLFWVYAGIMGLSLASIFVAYTGQSIARVFFITAGTFAGMSLYGYTTKRDLTAFGSFLIMGLIGLVIAYIVNMFMHSETFSLALSAIGVLIFTGLTAYDVQTIKNTYFEGMETEHEAKTAVMGALRLYLDFINLFLSLLRLMGDRR